VTVWNGDPDDDEGWELDDDRNGAPDREIPVIVPLNVIGARGPWGAVVLTHAKVYRPGFLLVVHTWQVRVAETADEWWSRQHLFFEDGHRETDCALSIIAPDPLTVRSSSGSGHGGRRSRQYRRDYWIEGRPEADVLEFDFISGIPEAGVVRFELILRELDAASSRVTDAASS
jgi:hypothetical protein